MTGDASLVVFALEPHSLQQSLCDRLAATQGKVQSRIFPDGESYLRIETAVKNCHCMMVAELSHPDKKYLPLVFLAATLRELGAKSVGLVAPYLSYMRQDRRFIDGEAITSRIFAQQLSSVVDWLVTIDPHLHRYHALDEIYSIPNRVVQGAPLLAQYLLNHGLIGQKKLFLVGPDAESEQWVSQIAAQGGYPFVVGNKQRFGDRDVRVTLPDLSRFRGSMAVIVDDVISSGQTILKCMEALQSLQVSEISCLAVHGIFADGIDSTLMSHGLKHLVTTNTIPHPSNEIDVVDLLISPVMECLQLMGYPSNLQRDCNG
jgi:ribose-phosphate pyrophosphokinase